MVYLIAFHYTVMKLTTANVPNVVFAIKNVKWESKSMKNPTVLNVSAVENV